MDDKLTDEEIHSIKSQIKFVEVNLIEMRNDQNKLRKLIESMDPNDFCSCKKKNQIEIKSKSPPRKTKDIDKPY